MIEKRPRQYAAEIAALPSRGQRAEALSKVPEHLRDMTKTHVMIAFDRRRK